MPKYNNKFKKGATSIYVVVIGTLLFSVITVSFIRIILNETNKTTNDELAQAAYDSALAGVEDAKTALKRYYECESIPETEGHPTDCDQITTNVEHGFETSNLDPANANYGYCDAIIEALSRRDASDPKGEVLIQEQKGSGNSGNIVQAYTCVTIDNTLEDYRATLDRSSTVRVIPLRAEHPESVTGVRISWYTEENGLFSAMNYSNKDKFYPTTSSAGIPVPPTITAQIIQTANSFYLDDFNSYDASTKTTDRGTIVLVPAGEDSSVVTTTSHPADDAITHIGHYSTGLTILADSNNHSYDRTTNNQPQKIKCRSTLSDEFACVASIEIPGPIHGVDGSGNVTERNANTFFLVLTLPYANPTTDFSVQMCTDRDTERRGDCIENGNLSIAEFKDAQIAVDSTGRANDMYSRVEARLEFKDNFPFAEFAIQATGNGDDSIKKNFYVTSNCIDTSDPYNIQSCPDTDDVND